MATNVIPWKYNNTPITSLSDMPSGVFGFIYKIGYTPTDSEDTMWYIGKKQLYYKHKKKLTKKQLLAYEGKKGRKPTHEYIQKESDWCTYYSSHPILKEIAKTESPSLLDRQIIEFAINKKHLTYLENKHLFCNGVLESPQYFNHNIQGRFFKDEFNEWFEQDEY